MNLPPQLWFKWQRFKTAVREAFGSGEQSYETTHRMCPHCRGLIERNTSVCPLCGGAVKAPASRAGTAAPGRVLGGLIPVPSTATSALVAANIALYGISWYLTQQSAEPGSGLSGGASGVVLLRLGAKYGPLMFAGEWWRLVTAMFLHAGLLHIGFNLWCLFDLGPTVESMFSTTKFIVIYLVTGVFGFVLSLFWSPFGLSVGASGAILGLIGALIGASFHHGSLGKDLRSQLWRWVIYIFAFGLIGGFFGMGLDNAAHLGGLLSGLALGYFVPQGEPETRASENLWNALAILAVLILAGSFALMALQLNRPIG
jgi:rhomboid protease GluP